MFLSVASEEQDSARQVSGELGRWIAILEMRLNGWFPSLRRCDRRSRCNTPGRSWRSPTRGVLLPRPDSSVVERGPEKAGVGGSIPSLATILLSIT